MKNRKKRLALSIGFSLFGIICLTLLVLEIQGKYLRRYIDDVIYDNKNHYLTCEQLPQLSEVEVVLVSHKTTLAEIEQVNPGLVGVDVDTTCPGKGDLVFWYASHQNRVEIEKIIGGETFFGIPYRLENR